MVNGDCSGGLLHKHWGTGALGQWVTGALSEWENVRWETGRVGKLAFDIMEE